MSVVDPETAPSVAVMTDVPVPTAEANPPAVIVATAGVSAVHVTLLVTSCVLESLNVLVAVNCWLAFKAIAGFAGSYIGRDSGLA